MTRMMRHFDDMCAHIAFVCFFKSCELELTKPKKKAMIGNCQTFGDLKYDVKNFVINIIEL